MFLAAIASCSGPSTDPAHPHPHPGSNAPVDGAIATAGPTERDCHDQFKHAAELAAADQKLTADELAKLEIELSDRYLTVCRAGSLDGHRCAMSATTLAELDRCHATPSSSTSNSRVAPGGMTPAAPRSP
jgi:hypothetical protein